MLNIDSRLKEYQEYVNDSTLVMGIPLPDLTVEELRLLVIYFAKQYERAMYAHMESLDFVRKAL